MNGITIILISAVVLIIGYLGYGRWLAKSWGVDSKALTPAVRMEDGKDFSPAQRFSVFAHQFSSICGAGPVTGTIVAMMFGWLPVLLWVLVGGIFFGAVHDFGALYASVKNNGKSLGQLIEKVGRDQIRPGGEQLAELDEGGAQLLKDQPQPLGTRKPRDLLARLAVDHL